jgi:hypothetical protein
VRLAPAQDEKLAYGIRMWLTPRAIWAHTRHVATVASAPPVQRILSGRTRKTPARAVVRGGPQPDRRRALALQCRCSEILCRDGRIHVNQAAVQRERPRCR